MVFHPRRPLGKMPTCFCSCGRQARAARDAGPRGEREVISLSQNPAGEAMPSSITSPCWLLLLALFNALAKAKAFSLGINSRGSVISCRTSCQEHYTAVVGKIRPGRGSPLHMNQSFKNDAEVGGECLVVRHAVASSVLESIRLCCV